MIRISDFIIRPSSLQQKTVLFILLPIFLILTSIGYLGMRLVRNVLLEQWQETAVAKLQQTAHQVDMRLLRPKELLQLHQNEPDLDTRSIINQLRRLDGVVQVNSIGSQTLLAKQGNLETDVLLRRGASLRQRQKLEIKAPKYDQNLKSETVSLVSAFTDSAGKEYNSIEVVISFENLINQIVRSPWWKSNKAFLVERDGNILASTTLSETANPNDVRKLKFGATDPLEKLTLKALQTNDSGTVFGPGKPPENISGFCRLTEAPWTIVLIAPGDMVLQPIINFKNYYFLSLGIGIVLALLYLRTVISRTTTAIRRVSRAASELAEGTSVLPLVVHSRDEVGELTHNFNIMAEQLQERLQLREAMHVAKEIQQNFLPSAGISLEGIDSAGICVYCDETGGDYFDLFVPPGTEGKMTIVVGDVAGHGIGAALLMATVRGLLRSRVCQPGTSAQMISDVNRLLCLDTTRSGNFVTLFFLTLDLETRSVNWVRCGHEPALVYTPGVDEFTELRGEGLVLGVDRDWQYTDYTFDLATEKQIILLGSDGIWEAENSRGERFGKQRIRELLTRYHDCDAQRLLQEIIAAISLFQDGHPQLDDITVAIVKTDFSAVTWHCSSPAPFLPDAAS